MRKTLQPAVLATLLLVSVFGSAQESTRHAEPLWEPPNIEWPSSGAGNVVIHRLSVAGFPILLDQTDLRKAKAKVGGIVGSRGDAGDAKQWLCYFGSDESGSWMLWLTSVEINGDAIGGFVWKSIEPGQSADRRCRNIRGSSPIKVELPVRLAMRQQQVARILGKPTSVRKSELYYMHSHEQTINAERFTISNGIEVETRNGIVVQIAAFETSSD